MSRSVKTLGAATTNPSHIATPTPMMPSWLPYRSSREGGAARLSTGFAGRPASATGLLERSGAGDVIEPLDQLIHGDFASVVDARDLAAIEHVKPVDDRIDVEDVVVDEDRRLADFLDVADEVEGLLGLAEREAHGRLVQDDELGLKMEGARDRDPLLLAARHGRHDIVGMHGGRGEAHVLAHQPRRFGPHPLDVEQAEPGAQLAPHEHVAPDRLLLGKRPLLIDRLDAEAPRLRDGPTVHALAMEANLAAGIGRVESHDDLDERRLARAVVAEQADNLAPVDLEIDPRERPHLSKRFGDVPEFDDRRFAGAGCRRLRHPASG